MSSSWGALVCSAQEEETERRCRSGLLLLMRGMNRQCWSLVSGDSNRTRRNGKELHQGMARLGVRKRFFTRGWLGSGTGSAVQWSWPQAVGAQGAFGQHFRHRMWMLVGPLWSQELDLVILVCAFQFWIFYGSFLRLNKCIFWSDCITTVRIYGSKSVNPLLYTKRIKYIWISTTSLPKRYYN